MPATALIGALVVAFAGLIMGSGAWPMKVLRKYQFEHWWFVAMVSGLVIAPWAVTITLCPNAFAAYRSVDPGVLIKSNLFALGWGVANVLCGLCFVRIGFALTNALLTGVGVSVGVMVPMIVKASGLFQNAPDLGSRAGLVVMVGVAVMLAGVVLASLAGFGRDQALKKLKKTSGSFVVGLIMTVIAGLLSCGISFAFVYSQGPIKDAMKAQGAGEIPSIFAVWAVGLMGGALVNIVYPIYLMTKKRSWGVLTQSWTDLLLALLIGINFCISVSAMGKGMLLLGALGASVGFGIQQAFQMTGGQAVGFISGEWRGVHGLPRHQMYAAIALLIAAAVIMAYGNRLT
jgi:L-rhamnose-H+ transport protein